MLNVHERIFLIDCGEGTQLQLRRNKIRFAKINHIFISHLHGDHVFGLYGLLSTLSLMGRKTDLNIYAPSNFESMLHAHLSDFDISLNYETRFHPLSGKDPVKIMEDKYITVTSFPLEHRIPAFGFLFREKEGDRKIIKEAIGKFNIPVSRMNAIKKGAGLELDDGMVVPNSEITTAPPVSRSFAYCSDTRYFKKLPSYVKGVDLLYHEATFEKDKHELAATTGHSTSTDAACVAREAGAGALVIGHFSARYRDVSRLVEEARAVFPETYPAMDGHSYEAGNVRSF